jgi:hypothetical protein
MSNKKWRRAPGTNEREKQQALALAVARKQKATPYADSSRAAARTIPPEAVARGMSGGPGLLAWVIVALAGVGTVAMIAGLVWFMVRVIGGDPW